MDLSILGVLLIALLSNEISTVCGDIGTATAYQPPYLPTRCNGYREDQFPPGNLFVAVGDGLWDNGAACGRRYRLRCISGWHEPCKEETIDVKVVDFCETPCPSTIQLSEYAFTAVSHHRSKVINVEFVQI